MLPRWPSHILLLILIGVASALEAQQLPFTEQAYFELTAPQLDVISGATQARLEQVQALVADRKWDEAVDALRDVAADDAAEDAGQLVALGNGTYVGLPTYCQLQLSHFPPEGLAAYRQQADATAEEWYRNGLAARDPAFLNRVVDECFCSSWGDDALLALGELSLERADFAAARRYWQAISPLLRDPQGRPAWFALHDVDLNKNWPQAVERWQNRPMPSDWLAYPDTDLNLADVRARLILVSIREQAFDRAAFELKVFERLHPDAEGRLAGKQGPYAPALKRLLESAHEWPSATRDSDWTTFASDPSRNAAVPALGRIDGPIWSAAVKLPPLERPTRGAVVAGLSGVAAIRETDTKVLAFDPLVVGDTVLYNDAHRILAADLTTGRPAVTKDGVLHCVDSQAKDERVLASSGEVVAAGEPCFTMTAVGNVLYARLGDDSTARLQPNAARRDERLLGIDLAREGLLTFEVTPDDGTWSFDGSPVGDGRRVYVAMRQSDVKPSAYVAAFDAATGRRIWRTLICSADTPGAGRGDEITHNLLTLVGDRIFINTNQGVVAALTAADGRVAWLRRYDRVAGRIHLPGPPHLDRDPSPCVYDGGLVFVAPADAPVVFALDADTGQTVWATDRLADAVNLLGVVDGNLIASGNRLWSVDARSGRKRFVWPESEHAGIRGFGRGIVAGDEVFWPSRNMIYVLNASTGQQSREPIDIARFTKLGANLVAAGGRLIVVGQEQMMAFGPAHIEPPTKKQREETETVASISGYLDVERFHSITTDNGPRTTDQ